MSYKKFSPAAPRRPDPLAHLRSLVRDYLRSALPSSSRAPPPRPIPYVPVTVPV